MTTTADPPRVQTRATIELRRPASLSEAVGELQAGGTALAGGTWIMRAAHRDEAFDAVYVALDRIAELRAVQERDGAVALGALLTHDELAAYDGSPALGALATAAARSAFPAIRSTATLGGNIGAVGFAEADLVPALLALGASVELVSPQGESTASLETYLASRGQRPAGELIARVVVPTPAGVSSAFERLTVLGGGEYSVANLALSVTLQDGVVRAARVAVGSVEEVARLCPAAAEALVGERLDAAVAERAGKVAAQECTGREGLDAPGWYRLAVLPALLRRATSRLIEEAS
jgi:carbon-monoxide dehydrogenase medium subunit